MGTPTTAIRRSPRYSDKPWTRGPDGSLSRVRIAPLLRAAQFRAVETYWYLRLVEGTPHIADLYCDLFPSITDRLVALLRETLALDYPSRILALAMGAGKTVLIGAIATEFTIGDPRGGGSARSMIPMHTSLPEDP